MTKEIPLTKGFVALVDDEDDEYLIQFSWSIDGGGYPQRATIIAGAKRPIRMHRDILELVGGEMADHKNRNKLDNRRENLRRCTRGQNNINKDRQSNNASGYKGVFWNKYKRLWTADIPIGDGKRKKVNFRSLALAVYEYNRAAQEIYGEFAFLNVFDPKDEVVVEKRGYHR